jgi:hypothetical protein
MTLREYAAPIRSLAVDAIGTEDVLRCLKPIWTTTPETVGRVRCRIEKVLDAAAAKKLREGENPALWRGHLDVWSSNLMVHSYCTNQRMRYGPGSSRERHDD